MHTDELSDRQPARDFWHVVYHEDGSIEDSTFLQDRDESVDIRMLPDGRMTARLAEFHD
jgi:hypothetical protein